MIKVNSDENVVVIIGGNEYCLKDKEDYKNFIIRLTDPVVKFELSYLEVDSSIQDSRLIAICKKYEEFFKSYLKEKESIVKKARETVEHEMTKNDTSNQNETVEVL